MTITMRRTNELDPQGDDHLPIEPGRVDNGGTEPNGASLVTAFPHLFSPIQIGSVTVKNRILSSGHDTVMAEDGRIGDRLVAYHEARARGGAGLIVAQVAGVHQSAKYSASILMADTDDCIAGYRTLAETVHTHGTMLFGQLFHDGREMMESQDGSLSVALAPSAVPTERFHVMPRAMPVPLIEEIVDVLRHSRPSVADRGSRRS